jgi:membrane associated rhomboid family serine protease
MFNLPPATRSLLLINVAVFALQYFGEGTLERYFALWPIDSAVVGAASFEPWQLITYGFLHDTRTATHLLFNMLALVMFGGDIERVWGPRRFLTYYLTCVLSGGVAQLLVALLDNASGETIGASAGVFGLLLAFAMMYPRRTILLIFPPIPMPAWLFVTGYGVLELYLGVTGGQANVAHFAHLGGMLGGYLLIRFGRARRR